MPSTQQYRRRIKSVKSTRQITKAMEMVASVKMQKAVKAISAERAYIQSTWKLLSEITESAKDIKNPLLAERPVEKVALLVTTSDRGLCGSFHADIFRKLRSWQKDNPEKIDFSKLDVIVIGGRGVDFISKIKLGQVIASFDSQEDQIAYDQTTAISKILIDGYSEAKYDKVFILYSHYVSSLAQKPVFKQLLPITKEHLDLPEVWKVEEVAEKDQDFLYEPDKERLVNQILPLFLRTQVYGAILESNASEQSARMVAMKNATDNAGDLIEDLQLTYNSIRQDSITREIAEISAGAESLA
jgi:F-type H+-transporting ATPase subunit gamma